MRMCRTVNGTGMSWWLRMRIGSIETVAWATSHIHWIAIEDVSITLSIWSSFIKNILARHGALELKINLSNFRKTVFKLKEQSILHRGKRKQKSMFMGAFQSFPQKLAGKYLGRCSNLSKKFPRALNNGFERQQNQPYCGCLTHRRSQLSPSQ